MLRYGELLVIKREKVASDVKIVQRSVDVEFLTEERCRLLDFT